ncbi:hypothetical protein MM26B8_01240 [Mycoplasmopsis meleagridis]|uniref:HTH HARE-type domain-containing protein n=1 Tax=Mycoplasmopsis meleagridis ATCC 25294 TaxID=1264554 RepID=A0A0F5H244_9BACT|nr:hypothetical protein [Mycoplasmopsis meleagridis]KKB26912.1 hypothetical protein MMELEA_03610 [Mycoplasmopsis meleagridis ATCC 25294]KUH47454.1 hypothetical protein ASB56_01130 [Mycoplasmopsis meleagridis]OAD18500.1 hypothetical protein MM26B8_01240 [Mycoplasmopsis meleagridis]VEU77630.1 Uncharacterised protein [Mycoplasmopsis meleagridis]
MKTMLDVALAFVKENCSNQNYIAFNEIFNNVESELHEKWEIEAANKNLNYETIQLNKIGELYRLLTVDSRFVRNTEGLWSIKIGYK